MRLARMLASVLLLLTVLPVVTWSAQHAQADGPELEWTSSLGDRVWSVATGPAGSVYVAATHQPPDGAWDPVLLVRRYEADGDVAWTRRWDPDHGSIWYADVAVGPGGLIAVAGTGTCDLYAECYVPYLRVYEPDGDVAWTRARGLRGNSDHVKRIAEYSGVAVTEDAVVVSAHCCGYGDTDGWLTSFELDGDLRWTRDLVIPGSRRWNDAPTAIDAGSRGDLFVAGWVARGSERSTQPADHDVFVQRLEPSGDVRWTRVLPDRRAEDLDTASSVDVGGDRLAIAGVQVGMDYAGHAWAGILSTRGELAWRHRCGRWRGYGSMPSVAILPSEAVVVSSSQRDRSDPGYDAEIRWYRRAGALRWRYALADDERFAFATHVVVLGDAEAIFAAGFASERRYDDTGVGYVWRLGA